VIQPRGPGYPGISVGQATNLARKIFQKNRTNPIDREAAAKDMGFAGLTGSSTKALADLSHYGLLDKAGKGAIRVSQRAVDILYPDPAHPASKAVALRAAAFSPSLFASLRTQFHDGVPSENSLRAYLVRQKYGSAAVEAIVTSYTDTCRLVQQEAVTESDGQHETKVAEPDAGTESTGQAVDANMPPVSPGSSQKGEVPVMSGERVVFVDEASPGRYLKVIASGELDAVLLEALEDFTKRRKKRLPGTVDAKGAQGAEEPVAQ
jgi:hypothetical protein